MTYLSTEMQMNLLRTALFSTLALMLMFSMTGCGTDGDYPQMTPVTITVMYDGQAIEGATVLFSPTNSENPSAQGRTDASGKASVRSFAEREGVLPGSYRVAVHKSALEGGQEVDDPDADPGFQPEVVNQLPERYASVSTSDLSIEVVLNGPVEQTFELTD
jgi:hypothetical protein